jgi:hypothetical protein
MQGATVTANLRMPSNPAGQTLLPGLASLPAADIWSCSWTPSAKLKEPERDMSKARQRLTDEFLVALERDYQEHGSAALERVRCEDPKAYLRIVSELVPRQQEIAISNAANFEGMSVTELRKLVIEGVADSIAGYVQTHLGEVETLVRQARKMRRNGQLPPDGYEDLSAADKWRMRMGRTP